MEPLALLDGLALRPVTVADAAAMSAAYELNRDHLAPWEPVRFPEFYTEPWWRAELDRYVTAYRAGTMLPLAVVDGDDVVGRFTLSTIERGVFQNARLGYWVDHRIAGTGVATAAVGAIVVHARDELGLHRIEASTLLHNAGSQRVLERNGFERTGMAPSYLRIAGWWQDHYLFQRLLDH